MPKGRGSPGEGNEDGVDMGKEHCGAPVEASQSPALSPRASPLRTCRRTLTFRTDSIPATLLVCVPSSLSSPEPGLLECRSRRCLPSRPPKPVCAGLWSRVSPTALMSGSFCCCLCMCCLQRMICVSAEASCRPHIAHSFACDTCTEIWQCASECRCINSKC